MNALEIIEQLRALKVDVVVENDALVISGRGDRLPDELNAALREHKAEVMVALGATHDVLMTEILGEIRPFLTPALRALPDPKLLVLVNYAVLTAFGKYMRTFDERSAAERARRSSDRG